MDENSDELQFLRKQNEISEYSSNTKTNFVFLLQIVFLYIVIIIIILYLGSIGLISNIFIYGSILIFGFVVFLIFYNRIFLTSKYRDSRNFDRFNYGDGTNVTASYNKLPPSDGIAGSFKRTESNTETCRTKTVCIE